MLFSHTSSLYAVTTLLNPLLVQMMALVPLVGLIIAHTPAALLLHRLLLPIRRFRQLVHTPLLQPVRTPILQLLPGRLGFIQLIKGHQGFVQPPFLLLIHIGLPRLVQLHLPII